MYSIVNLCLGLKNQSFFIVLCVLPAEGFYIYMQLHMLGLETI
jgi:hypothetical protein